MTTWFVTRHAGAREWAEQQGITIDRIVEHLDPNEVAPGDQVLGTLPVNLICDLNERGADYLHLVLPLSPQQRGQEITAKLMTKLGARLEGFRVQRTMQPDADALTRRHPHR